MRKEIKQAFKNDTIEHVSGFDQHGNIVWLSNEFGMFTVEGENGRKAFRTFDGAFNKFMKMSKGFEMTVVLDDGNTVDVDTFIEEVA